MATKPRDFNLDYYYHIYNRGVEKRTVFETTGDYQRFLALLNFYKHEQMLSFAQYNELTEDRRRQYHKLNPTGLETLRVRLLSYCLMPNHFHLVLKPVRYSGITTYISDVSNSHTKYFNIKNERSGRLFQGPFKDKELRSEVSLMQVVRYVHLNPVMSSRTNPLENLSPEDYPFSSYSEWLRTGKINPSGLFSDDEEVKRWVAYMGGVKKYREFVESKVVANKPELGIEDLIIEEVSRPGLI